MGCIRACARAHPFVTMVTTRSLVRLHSNLADLFRSPDTADLFRVSGTVKLAGTRRRRNLPGLACSVTGKRRSETAAKLERARRRQSWPGAGDSETFQGTETVELERARSGRAGQSSDMAAPRCFELRDGVAGPGLAEDGADQSNTIQYKTRYGDVGAGQGSEWAEPARVGRRRS